MKLFWNSVIRPILETMQPGVVIEVGSLAGETTEQLVQFAQERGFTVHCIDPLPRFDVAAWQAEYGEHFQFHQAKSLEILRDLPPADLVLIDGDHNWYTVYHELKQLAEAAATHHRPYPVVLFHDIGWPYARRDLYYDPTDIPPEFRHPYEVKGIWPNRSELHQYGVNHNLANASSEGGPRNGVLTAVEDFVAESDEPMRLLLIDGFHGLGILFPESLAEHSPRLAAHLNKIDTGLSVLSGHLRALNDQVIAYVVRRNREILREAERATNKESKAENRAARKERRRQRES